MTDQNPKDQKLEEMKHAYLKQQEEDQKKQEAESQLQSVLKKILTEEARQRLANVRLVNPEQHAKAIQAVIDLVQKGYVREKITDEQLKEILRKTKNDRE